MYEALINFFLNKPSRLAGAGHAVFGATAFLLIAGMYGRVATVGVAAILGMSGASTHTRTLEDIYPNLPTWWIPESAFGFTLSAALAMAGIILILIGRKWQRILDN